MTSFTAHHLCHPGQKPNHCWPCEPPAGLCLEGIFGLRFGMHHVMCRQAAGYVEI